MCVVHFRDVYRVTWGSDEDNRERKFKSFVCNNRSDEESLAVSHLGQLSGYGVDVVVCDEMMCV